MNKKELWLRLNDYHFNDLVPANMWEHIQSRFGGADASTKAFAHKIARKRSWNNAFALRAVSEYKKFVYLGIVSEFVVTPSMVIDQVWHQHLLFSKAYRSFCQDVIQYDFDHNPELVPMEDQTNTFSAQYMDTLELYKNEFGYAPPADIWSRPKFDKKVLRENKNQSKKKKEVTGSSNSGNYYDSTPLYQSFETSDGNNTEFGGFEGGDSGGSGAGGSWGDNSSTDSSASDSGSGSSCSSGCGGGD